MKAATRLIDLPHLSALLYGRAHLIAPTKLETILRVVETRAVLEAGAVEYSNASQSDCPNRDEGATGSIAVIPVLGTLVNRHSHVSAASGLVSYGDISRRLTSASEDPHVEAILLDIDSSGGEASGCFDLADQIYAARRIKPIWANVNDTALSAAYAIASACERVCVSRTGSVGSIGVVAAHIDQSAADERAGHKYSFISAGDHKTDGNPHEPLRPEVEAQIQGEVNRIYGLFVETVARNRGLVAEVIRSTEAAVYGGEKGLSSGLADAVQPFATTLNELSQEIETKHKQVLKEPQVMDDTHAVENQETLPEDKTTSLVSQAGQIVGDTQAQVVSSSQPQAQTFSGEGLAYGPGSGQVPSHAQSAAQVSVQSTSQEQRAQPHAAAKLEASLRAEFAEISAIADQAQKLGLTVDVAKALETRTSPMVLRKQVLDQLASRDAASLVVATPEPQAGGGDPNENIGGSLKAAAEAEAKAMMGETAYG